MFLESVLFIKFTPTIHNYNFLCCILIWFFCNLVARKAVVETGITKLGSCHNFRHSFASHLLQDGYDIRTIQQLLEHKDIRKTMICTHVMNKGAMAVRSPLR
ncbi:MAG: tyrosine-type recombinase/integrase [Candidatus Marinimicrobia bacterium]|nr:tyrosine-type recombinase/integrase [Candidatus Neomarinimicrobiota bacterium]